ncbi:MAG: DNA polymerase III subunit delta' [Lachnospiraceae bacterium]|nr:DNA polymerase III subunit delta' [Lachnospiraceae bacterium]
MAELKKVIGQNHIIEHFKNAIRMDRVSHAYIINGEDNSGKEELANWISMALQCEKGDGEPCLECRSCKQALGDNHPDIKWVSHEKTVISVDDIREQINSDVEIKPYSGKRKVYIVPDAEKMREPAQNTLLKTLEEPPAYAVILLLTNNSNSFLQTIMSRCLQMNIRPVRDEIIKEYLKNELSISDYEAGIATAFSGGNPGKAAKLATSEEFSEMKNDVSNTISSIVSGTMEDITAAIKKAGEYKEDIMEYLDLFQTWFRDMLIYKSCGDDNLIIFQKERMNISQMSEMTTYQDINKILEVLDTTRWRMMSNVNFDGALEVLFITIKERIK